jgi:predicted transposase YbfD/YdcC
VAPVLLAGIDLRNKVVTGDALFAQKNLSRQIVEQQGDYLFTVKANQATLLDDIATLFADLPAPVDQAEQRGRHGNRHEVRRIPVLVTEHRARVWASSELNDYIGWPHLAQVCCIERQRECKGQVQVETAYAITSLCPNEASPSKLLALVRGHWGIENRLHWVRDVTFREDQSQVRKGSAPQVMAGLRNTAIGLLRLNGGVNIAAALRRNACHPEEALSLVGIFLPPSQQ